MIKPPSGQEYSAQATASERGIVDNQQRLGKGLLQVAAQCTSLQPTRWRRYWPSTWQRRSCWQQARFGPCCFDPATPSGDRSGPVTSSRLPGWGPFGPSYRDGSKGR